MFAICKVKGVPSGSTGGSGGGVTGSSTPRSPGHSWSNANVHGPCPAAEVNKRDHYGRTALHHVASSVEPVAIDYLHALLAHPGINPNLADVESGYTALHRALYAGNLLVALILLRRSDVDTRAKDYEGLTPFDLYNGTVHGTNPAHESSARPGDQSGPYANATAGSSELYTWGTNRNYTLGLGDGDDRGTPDRVTFNRPQGEYEKRALPAGARFERIRVRDVRMSKLHTVVLTAEKSGNVWVCGLGSNGRLGGHIQTQTNFEPLRDFRDTARSIAVASDHTLIVSESGSVYSFGHNRFQQLGYAIEHGLGITGSTTKNTSKGGGAASATFGGPAAATNNADLDLQISARKLAGPLKKEVVVGAAASKMHSAVFTADGGLFTWGTNTGQLGYDRSATPVQITPRRVTATALSSSHTTILQLAATDYATAVLLSSLDVVVIHNDGTHRITFPMSRFARPPQAKPKPSISRLTSSGTTFAALSDMGDLFTFTLEHPSEYAQSSAPSILQGGSHSTGERTRPQLPKPQLVWSVRKRFTAVRDVAIGSDGSIILCTESGHVFVRTRRAEGSASASIGADKSSKSSRGAFKFHAVSHLQRVVKVAMNESGGMAAIKADLPLKEVRVRGATLNEDLGRILPLLKAQPGGAGGRTTSEGERDIAAEFVDVLASVDALTGAEKLRRNTDEDSDEDESGDGIRERYVKLAQLLAEAARRWMRGHGTEAPYGLHNLVPPFGCDMFVVAQGRYIPAHRVVLAARVPAFQAILENPTDSALEGVSCHVEPNGPTTLTWKHCSFGAALLLLHYLYVDDVPCIWTSSVGYPVEEAYRAANIDRMAVQLELRELANTFGLAALMPVLSSPVAVRPASCLQSDFARLFDERVAGAEEEGLQSALHDVEIEFEDRTVPAHSALLKRSPFFAALFQPHWTASRWRIDGVIEIGMQHMAWDVARIVLRHLYTDAGIELFDGTDDELTQDAFLDFVVRVLAAATELLLDKLKLVCSVLLQRRIIPTNISSLLADADYYNASELKDVCMDFCTRTMESLLEAGSLDEANHKTLRDLTHYVRRRQDERMHRDELLALNLSLVEKHREYYDNLDLAKPSLNMACYKVPYRKWTPAAERRRRESFSPAPSPDLRAIVSSSNAIPSLGDAGLMFSMDEDEEIQQQRSSPFSAGPRPSAWRSRTAEAEKAAAAAATTAALAAAAEAASKTLKVGTPTGGRDLRSIMAAEQARRSSTTTRGSPAMGPTTHSFSPSPATPAGGSSAAPSGAATPIGPPRTTELDIIPLNLSAKLSQRDRKKQQQQVLLQQQQQRVSGPSSPPVSASGSGLASSRPAGSPWKLPVTTSACPRAEQALFPTPPSVPRTGVGNVSKLGSTPDSPRTGLPQGQGAVGPIFSPARLPPGVGITARRNTGGSSDLAWGGAARAFSGPGSPPLAGVLGAQLPLSPTRTALSSQISDMVILASDNAIALPSSSSGTPLTFAQIQAQQRADEALAAQRAAPTRKSFAEILEEERRVREDEERERKEREEFEIWFADEARRTQQARQQAGQAQGKEGEGKKKKRAPKKKVVGEARIDDSDNEGEGEDERTRGDGGQNGRGRGRGRGGRGGNAEGSKGRRRGQQPSGSATSQQQRSDPAPAQRRTQAPRQQQQTS